MNGSRKERNHLSRLVRERFASQHNINCTPEGGYDWYGRRTDLKLESTRATVFLEVWAGNTRYAQNKILQRDSRLFNRDLSRSVRRSYVYHWVCNTDAYKAVKSLSSNRETTLHLSRFVDILGRVSQAKNTLMYINASTPSEDDVSEVAAHIDLLLAGG